MKNIKDRIISAGKIAVTAGVIGLSTLGIGEYGCSHKFTSKEIAIQKLEDYLSVNPKKLEENKNYGLLNSEVSHINLRYKVLDDSTYAITFGDGKTTKYDMSIEQSKKDSTTNTYIFHMNMFPSYVEIDVTGDSAKIVRKRP